MFRSRFVAGSMILMMIACGACIFEPRTAEEPSGSNEYQWLTPYLSTPKNVFLNLASGLASNVDSNYERSLGADFAFIPTDQVAAELGADKFADWTKTVELEWLARVKTLYTGARKAHFGDANGNFTTESVSGTTAIYEGVYEITLEETAGGTKSTYAGIARFTLSYVTQGWVITEWRDLEASGTYPTAGYLRGSLRVTN